MESWINQTLNSNLDVIFRLALFRLHDFFQESWINKHLTQI